MKTKKIFLGGKYGDGKFTLVDNQDYEKLCQVKWSVNSSGYVSSVLGMMHRVIMKPNIGMVIDHRNGNKLDNRRCNLVICTQSQNNMKKKKYKLNSSQYKGVTLIDGKWKVKIVVDRKPIYLGTFPIRHEKYAAQIYDAASRILHKEFAVLNFPNDNAFPNFDLDEWLRIVRKKTSKYRGVSYSQKERKWKAAITIKREKHFLGTFDEETTAALCVDEFLKKHNLHHKLNFKE